MKKPGKKFSNTKDKVVGEIKEAAGKATGNEQLEWKGKFQSSKAGLKMKTNDFMAGVSKKLNSAMVKRGRK